MIVEELGGLVKRTELSELLAIYRAQITKIRESFATVHAAEHILSEAFYPSGKGQLDKYRTRIAVRSSRWSRDSVSWDDVEGALDMLKRDCWRAVVDRLEIWRMLSEKRAKELSDRLEKGELPELTEDSVADFFAFYAENVSAMMKECVTEVFDWLRPRGWTDVAKLKTNAKNARVELGRKIIISGAVEEEWGGKGFRIRYDRSANWMSVEKVFWMLDGKGDLSRSATPEIVAAVKAAGPAGIGETDLFRFKAYKNGNLHVEFKRLDLLARLNQVAGGANLKSEPTHD
jgi:hypothetical protein